MFSLDSHTINCIQPKMDKIWTDFNHSYVRTRHPLAVATQRSVTWSDTFEEDTDLRLMRFQLWEEDSWAIRWWFFRGFCEGFFRVPHWSWTLKIRWLAHSFRGFGLEKRWICLSGQWGCHRSVLHSIGSMVARYSVWMLVNDHVKYGQRPGDDLNGFVIPQKRIHSRPLRILFAIFGDALVPRAAPVLR